MFAVKQNINNNTYIFSPTFGEPHTNVPTINNRIALSQPIVVAFVFRATIELTNVFFSYVMLKVLINNITKTYSNRSLKYNRKNSFEKRLTKDYRELEETPWFGLYEKIPIILISNCMKTPKKL